MRCLHLCIVVAVFAGCHKSPTAPTRQPAALVALTLSPGGSVLLVGRPQQLTAYALYGDGTSRPVAAAWSVDAVSIATVDLTGGVVAQRPGTVSVTASFEGQSVSRRFRSVADLSGEWGGSAIVIECRAVNDSNCAYVHRSPSVGVHLFVDQFESRVRAYIISLNLQLFADGRVEDDGALVLAGERRSAAPNFFIMRVSDWRTLVGPDGTMSGTFVVWTNEQGSFEATRRMTIRVEDVRRLRLGPVSFPAPF